MNSCYSFYALFGGRRTWHPPCGDLTISSNGIEWPGGDTSFAATAPDSHQVDLCRTFLARCWRTKHPRQGSYWMKHVVQNWAGEYVSNGALVQAALTLGIGFSVCEGSPNGILTVSKRSVKKARLSWKREA